LPVNGYFATFAGMTGKKVYIETYGCQMNVVDSEVVAAILQQGNYTVTEKVREADLILVNTCSIRDNAEQRVFSRIRELGLIKLGRSGVSLGVIGCMAERLKEQLLEQKGVDLVVGPDAYRQLPDLLREVESGQKGFNTLLSMEETYGDISPVRMDRSGVTAFVSIMRGCNNFCSYCVVPATRGRERSRDPGTIKSEVVNLVEKGYREVTLLGQNVNSYRWKEAGNEMKFEQLLEMVAEINPGMRIRFATSHPKDMTDELLRVIARYPNLCRAIHLPVQSGSSTVLKRMNRRYTREHYMDRVEAIRSILPGASLSTDIIAGFCGESEEEHRETLSLMELAGYDFAFMFKYSERPGTYAALHFGDDIPEAVKSRRLNEIIGLQSELSLKSKQKDVGSVVEVLAEGTSKRSEQKLYGRTSTNKVVVFPRKSFKPGDLVNVRINNCTAATLLGEPD
jgi:tRNA-2-methylthio-N6-dimethylallyladenosine synthase